MTAQRSTFLLLLAAACLALWAGPTWAEPVETPPEAPPAGAADEMPEAPPADTAAEPVVETMQALPGRLPNTDGPKIPNVIGKVPQETNRALSAWRLRVENVVTDRSYIGRVVDQHPDAGSTLAPGEVITLVVGIATLPGRGYTCVPPIEDLKLEAGVAALRKQGFDITLRTAESYDGDKGVILAQAPRPASVAVRGSKVIVVVGKGGLGEPPVVEEPPAPVPLPAPAEVPAAPAPDVPPAGPSVVPEGPPVVEEPAMPEPPAEEPVAPTVPVEPPPAEEPPTPPTPPLEEPVPPVPPTEEPPLPVVEEPPAPPPVEPPKPRVMLRVPTLAGPASGESYPRAFGSTFTWGTIRGAEAYEWELQVEGEDGTWTTAMTETVEGTSYRPKRMEAGRYRWRVRAVAGDVQGDWSDFRRLFLY